MSDPPWRLDPLQTIIRVNFPEPGKPGDKPPGKPDNPDVPPPGKCKNCTVSLCGLILACNTCVCPGILCCNAATGCLVPRGCTYVGMNIYPESGAACASHMWDGGQWWNCCGGNGCSDLPDFVRGPNFYAPGEIPPFAFVP